MSVKDVSLPPTEEQQAAVSGATRGGPATGRHDAGVAEVGPAAPRRGPRGRRPGRGGARRTRMRRRTRRSTARTAIDAATDMASRSPRRASRTAGRRPRRGWVAASGVEVLPHQQGGLPVEAITLAEERQWMWRRSSPGTYSRRAWKARSLWRPRRSGRPRGRAAARRPGSPAGTIGGRTSTSRTGVHTMSREKMPIGSPRRVVTGPTRMTPRRSVRMSERLLVHAPGAAASRCRSGGWRTRRAPRAVVGSSRPPAMLRTTTPAATESPAATRSGWRGAGRRRRTSRPRQEGRRDREQQQAGDRHHGHLPPARRGPRAYAAPTPMPRTSHPAGRTIVSSSLHALHRQLRPPGPWAVRPSRAGDR